MEGGTRSRARAEKVVEFFGEGSTYMDAPYVWEARRAALEVLGVDPSEKRILDVGCGDGSISLPWAGRAASITLVDLSPSMLRRAREQLADAPKENVEILEGDFTKIDVGKGYDLVLCLGVLAHMESLERAVSQLASFLRRGGELVIQLTDAERALGNLLYRRGQRAARRTHGYEILRLGTTAVIAACEREKLMFERLHRFSFLLPGMGRLPGRLVRAIELASVRIRAFQPFVTDALILFRKGNGA